MWETLYAGQLWPPWTLCHGMLKSCQQMNFCLFGTVCQVKVSRHTVISDARMEYDPAEEGTKVPEHCHLLSAVTNGKSMLQCINATMYRCYNVSMLQRELSKRKDAQPQGKSCRWEMRRQAICPG